MKKIVKFIIPVLLIVFLAVGVMVPETSALTLREGAEAARCDGCPSELFGETGAFRQITNTVLFIVGVIAVIMLIIGGIKYVISGGDSKKVTDAKNTILYAIIGMVIAVFSYAIVTFVLSALPTSESEQKLEETMQQTGALYLDTKC